MEYAICYISNSRDLNYQQTEELLKFCQDQNKLFGIKGVLLYSEGSFFQILEGEKQIVLGLFEKIKKDPRHHELIQIIGREIDRGSFDGYKVDIISENLKYDPEVPREYIEALKGIPLDVRKPMERMLKMFIATR